MLSFFIFVLNYLGAENKEVKDYIYVSGGKSGKTTYENCVLKMDINMGKWDQFKTMSTRRCRHHSIINGDQMYLIGGYNGSDYVHSAENEYVSLSEELAT